jgi:hypothetical protein
MILQLKKPPSSSNIYAAACDTAKQFTPNQLESRLGSARPQDGLIRLRSRRLQVRALSGAPFSTRIHDQT